MLVAPRALLGEKHSWSLLEVRIHTPWDCVSGGLEWAQKLCDAERPAVSGTGRREHRQRGTLFH